MALHPTHSLPHSNANRLEILDLPADVLVLIFSQLNGEDFVRCTEVCRAFADLIHSNLYLQYRIELAWNGMVDGEPSTLPVSERLQRLGRYSSNFSNGIFDHEDLSAHPDYLREFRAVEWRMRQHHVGATSALYVDPIQSNSFLTIFIRGSAKAGIKPRRWIRPVGSPGDSTRLIRAWLIDRVQDLLVTIEAAAIDPNTRMSRLLEIRFCSFSRSDNARVDHSNAALPFVQVFLPAGIDETVQIRPFSIAARYVIWGRVVWNHGSQSYLMHVLDWRTGQTILQLDFGDDPTSVCSLDDCYLLVAPRNDDDRPCLTVCNLSSPTPDRPLCKLQLPDPNLDPHQRVEQYHLSTSRRPQVSEGCFRTDMSLSMLVVEHYVRGPWRGDYTSHLLIPCATVLARICAAVDNVSGDSHLEGPDPPLVVPWSDWGRRASLRLRVPLPSGNTGDPITLIPLGSRMPVVAFDDAWRTRPSVYVFDLNPLAARRFKSESGTAIVKDVEAALPGVVDPECSSIPYVVYRFPLPSPPARQRTRPVVRAVNMCLTGFTVTFEGVGPTETEQTWTI